MKSTSIQFITFAVAMLISFAVISYWNDAGKSNGVDHVAEKSFAHYLDIPRDLVSEPRNLHAQNDGKRALLRRVDADFELNVPFAIHLIQLNWIHAEIYFANSDKGLRVIDLLLDERVSQRYFELPVFSMTPYGCRIATKKRSQQGRQTEEYHRDQLLAVLAAQGVGLDQEINCDNQNLCLRDLLNDCVANFRISQLELEWSTVAFCHFLHSPTWRNRFDERMSFDILAEELLQRPVPEGCCGGTHRLVALSYILERDNLDRVLSTKNREAIESSLNEWELRALRTQSPSGFWSLDWCTQDVETVNRWSPLDDRYNRMLATTHLVEWLEIRSCNAELEESILAAKRFMRKVVSDMPVSEIQRDFCPFFHVF